MTYNTKRCINALSGRGLAWRHATLMLLDWRAEGHLELGKWSSNHSNKTTKNAGTHQAVRGILDTFEVGVFLNLNIHASNTKAPVLFVQWASASVVKSRSWWMFFFAMHDLPIDLHFCCDVAWCHPKRSLSKGMPPNIGRWPYDRFFGVAEMRWWYNYIHTTTYFMYQQNTLSGQCPQTQ